MQVSVLHIDGPWLPTNGSERVSKSQGQLRVNCYRIFMVDEECIRIRLGLRPRFQILCLLPSEVMWLLCSLAALSVPRTFWPIYSTVLLPPLFMFPLKYYFSDDII